MSLPTFTDPLLAEWQRTVSEPTQDALTGASVHSSPALVVLMVARSEDEFYEESAIEVRLDLKRLVGAIDAERDQLRADLLTALAAAGPMGTPLPPEFCARHFARRSR